MPVYLKSIGFSIVYIGILEGLAEAVAGLSKGYFGKRSDSSGKRVPFVQVGYVLSAISKPMMAICILPLWVFFARSLDRFGKGIRTGARDAMLSDEATPITKGKVFGFHRSMDTLGAAIGPIIALIYLSYYPENYKTLFIIAIIPGALSVLASLLLKDKKNKIKEGAKTVSFFSFFSYWQSSPLVYRKLTAGLLVFALINSSDIFLLLHLKQSGLSDTHVIGAYIFYNLIYAVFAFPLGILADKLGLKKIYIAGLIVFGMVYLGMAFNTDPVIYFILFFGYGLYAAATEGISKAWISNITDGKDTATAIGTFAGFQSICAMFASTFAGIIWYYFGASTSFFITGIMTCFLCIYFNFKVPSPKK